MPAPNYSLQSPFICTHFSSSRWRVKHHVAWCGHNQESNRYPYLYGTVQMWKWSLTHYIIIIYFEYCCVFLLLFQIFSNNLKKFLIFWKKKHFIKLSYFYQTLSYFCIKTFSVDNFVPNFQKYEQADKQQNKKEHFECLRTIREGVVLRGYFFSFPSPFPRQPLKFMPPLTRWYEHAFHSTLSRQHGPCSALLGFSGEIFFGGQKPRGQQNEQHQRFVETAWKMVDRKKVLENLF